ncbi:salicylate 1-monooxygenase [compost metagenome]
MSSTHNATNNATGKVLIIGGGIGGLAAALALARQGIRIELLEQAEQIGEIGAGIQLAANAFAALDALGVGEAARSLPTTSACATPSTPASSRRSMSGRRIASASATRMR